MTKKKTGEKDVTKASQVSRAPDLPRGEPAEHVLDGVGHFRGRPSLSRELGAQVLEPREGHGAAHHQRGLVGRHLRARVWGGEEWCEGVVVMESTVTKQKRELARNTGRTPWEM